jgi:aminopeptidase N
MKKLLFILIAFVSIAPLAAQDFVCRPHDEGARPRQHNVDIIKMSLEVSFVPEQKLVKGKVSHLFTPLQKKVDSIFFDAPKIRIQKATLDGKDLKFTTDENGVTVFPSNPLTWDKQHTIVFEYEANPKRGIYFIGWELPQDATNTNPWRIRRQIWTQGQGIDNRHWIPMYDDANDKFITETTVTFDSKYQVLSNGNKLKEKDNGNGTKTWHYAMTKPHAGYLLMLGIGEYKIMKRKTSRGVPLNFYYYPDLEDRAEPVYRHSEYMFDFLEKETGVPYPWESYSQIMVQDFIYGAMENTTATIFGDFFNVDKRAYLDRNYVGVNCHELTHQWFGDMITHRSRADIWLHESYATHYPKVMKLRMEGEAAYQWAHYAEMQRALAAGEKDNYPVRHSQGGSSRWYPKGSVVISMLKDVLGEESFNRVIKHYLNKHAYQNVETNDLYQAIQDVLGESPDWFFNQWIYNGGEPHYKVSWEDVTSKGSRKTRIVVSQIQEQNQWVGLFKMPIDIEVYYKDGSDTRQTVWVEKETEIIDIPNTKGQDVLFIVFDAGNKVLKNLTFERDFNELALQALNAREPIDRFLALEALRETDFDTKRELLHNVYRNEKFYGLRAEAAGQFVNDSGSYEYIKKALLDKDVHVRKAVINSVEEIPFPLINEFEALLTDSSYEVIETALTKLTRDFEGVNERFLNKTKDVLGMHNAIRIIWLEKMGSNVMTSRPEHWQQLVEFVSPRYEFRTRLKAFEALKRINLFNAVLFQNALDAATSENRRLAGPAFSFLEFITQNSTYKTIMQDYVNLNTLSSDEADVVKRLGLK